MGPTALPGAIEEAARAWLAEDPDPITRGQLHALLDGLPATADDLIAAFDGRLQFGTAGLRGVMGPGPQRMNVVMVRRSAAGLAAHLLVDAARRRNPTPVDVVVGYDARHRSADFAHEAARVLAGAGLRVEVLPRALPTPVLAYAVRARGARAGIMITASHNPPEDNGVKVYLGDGAQIVPPVDGLISAAIDAVGPLATVPLAAEGDDRLVVLGHELVDDYVAAVVARAHAPGARAVRVAYTPMHGVGGDVALAAFAAAGFPTPAVVAAQGAPDPDFPTVRFPNPEEPGAMDLVVAQARAIGADVALANDPDADRLAVAIPDPEVDGGWRVLRGDEVGWLLADHVLARTDGPERVVACSLVSSTLLARMAAEAGVRSVVTLTGFKWIARAADGVPGGRFTFGYEEALGYAVHDLVRDKDGISAALAMAEVAALALADGTTVAGRLADLERRYGTVLTGQLSPRFEGPDGAARMAAVMAAARRAPGQLAGLDVTAVEDLAGGDPPADVVVVHLGPDVRVIVRPSGTEPKAKVYLEVVGRQRDAAEARMAALRVDVAAWLGI